MSDQQQLTRQEMEAIATVVARLSRGRGKWFDAEATAVRFGKVALQNLGFRAQVIDAAAKVRAKVSRNIEWDLRRLERSADELMANMRKRAARASKTRRRR